MPAIPCTAVPVFTSLSLRGSLLGGKLRPPSKVTLSFCLSLFLASTLSGEARKPVLAQEISQLFFFLIFVSVQQGPRLINWLMKRKTRRRGRDGQHAASRKAYGITSKPSA